MANLNLLQYPKSILLEMNFNLNTGSKPTKSDESAYDYSHETPHKLVDDFIAIDDDEVFPSAIGLKLKKFSMKLKMMFKTKI